MLYCSLTWLLYKGDYFNALTCRHLHADVIEWLWFLATHHEVLFQFIHGDKDLFLRAFQLSNKEAAFQQDPFLPRLALAKLVS